MSKLQFHTKQSKQEEKGAALHLLTAGLSDLLHFVVFALNLFGMTLTQTLRLHLQTQLGLKRTSNRPHSNVLTSSLNLLLHSDTPTETYVPSLSKWTSSTKSFYILKLSSYCYLTKNTYWSEQK